MNVMSIENQNKFINVNTILKYTFGLVPIVAGLDKYFNILVNWEKYLSPFVSNIIPATTFMHIVGVIEIIAGIIVLAKPRIGAYIVSAWLIGIVLNLLTTGQYFDIAVRDTVMAIGAFCLAKLTEIRESEFAELGAKKAETRTQTKV
jgi:uncharacterized membrane protein YphA (DoxX/SURF4 family)